MTQELWSRVDEYIVTLLVPSDDALDAALVDSTQAGLPAINVAPNQGKLLHLLARTIRDFTRVSEMSVAAIDTLMTLSGTAGFASSQPIQRAWRDIHFASTHIGVNPEANYGHFGRAGLSWET